MTAELGPAAPFSESVGGVCVCAYMCMLCVFLRGVCAHMCVWPQGKFSPCAPWLSGQAGRWEGGRPHRRTAALTHALAVLQELCRQRMAVRTSDRPEAPHTSRISSVSSQFSDGPMPSPSARSSTSSWSEEPAQPNMDISTGHMVLVRPLSSPWGNGSRQSLCEGSESEGFVAAPSPAQAHSPWPLHGAATACFITITDRI